MSKVVQDYLEKGLYGTPEIKPEEKKKFLGTYRERVVFVLTLKELTALTFDAFAKQQFQQYPDGQILLNAKIDIALQSHVMQLAQQNNMTFRMVDANEQGLSMDDIVLVYAVEHAINKEDISFQQVKPVQKQSVASPKKVEKESKRTFSSQLLNKLFGKELP